MDGEIKTNKKKVLGRRSFLKGTTAALGLVTLAGTGCTSEQSTEPDNSADAVARMAPDEEIFQGLCRGNCGGGCRLNVHVREGKVVKTTPVLDDEHPLDNMICPRGYTHPQRMYAPERIQYPMRRAEGTARGAGQWERISWDEAIDEISSTWKELIEEYGSSSIGYSFGAGTYANNYYAYMRLWNCIGATGYAQEYDMTGLRYSWRIFGMSLYLVGNFREDEINAKTIVVWACNATIGTHARWKYMNEAIKKGAKLIVIDPIFTGAAQKADLWIPIKPATDAVLAMAMCKYYIDEGKDDREFIKTMSVAPFLVKEDGKFLRAIDLGIEVETEASGDSSNPLWSGGGAAETSPVIVVDEAGNHGFIEEIADPALTGSFNVGGFNVKTAYQLFIERISEWTLERAAEVTGIPVETIVQLSEMYLDGPTTLHYSWGNDHISNGGTTAHAQYMVPIITGQMGKPGAGFQGSAGGATTGFAGENWLTIIPNAYTPGVSAALMDIKRMVDTNSYNGQPIYPKSMFFYSGNPLDSHGGGVALRQALDTMELIITADTVWNATANYSDIVLPVPHWFEYETYRTCPSDYIDFNDVAVPPQFECKEDVEITALLGKAMGFEDEMAFMDTDGFHSMFLDTEISEQYGISWETLKQQKHMMMAPRDWYYGSKECPFGTASGRAEFYIEDVAPTFDMTLPLDAQLLALPSYQPPFEIREDNPLREKYPLVLYSHRDRFKVHTAFSKSPWLLEIQPEPTVEINPLDAQARDIAEGDYVKVYNDRGFVVLKAHLDASMQPGITWTEHTWLSDQYVEGHYSDLLHMDSYPYNPTNHPFDTLVEIEKN